MRRATTPSDRAAPTVEDSDGDPGLPGDVPYGPEGLVDLPLGGGNAPVLVGVRVADHDLLGTAPESHYSPVGVDGQQGPEGRTD